MNKSLKWAAFDALLNISLWNFTYFVVNGMWPGLQRGILCLIPLIVFFQWLLGSYSCLSAGKPGAWNRFQILIIAFVASIAIFASYYLIADLFYDSSHVKRAIWPLFVSSCVSDLMLSLFVRFRHLFTPQSRWLLIANREERDLITREILCLGMVIPAALEWRSSSIKTSIPLQLADLLGLHGVVLGSGLDVKTSDHQTFINWQRKGLQVTSLRSWFAKQFQRLPTELLPSCESECEIMFSINRLDTRLRLKRVLDLLLLIPYIAFMIIMISGCAVLAALRSPSKLQLKAPIFSVTRCVGLDGQIFDNYRFSSSNLFFHSFQHLPQIWNILKGEMSFVGPRPITPKIQQQLEEIDPKYRLRLRITPGLTSWGRIHGSVVSKQDLQRIELQRDLFYIRYADISFDILVILKALTQTCRSL